MINVILLILGLCVLGLLVMIVYAALKPTDDTRVVMEEKTPLKLESLDHDKAVLSFEVPLRNKSAESAAITDCFVRPYLPQEQFLMPGVKAMWKKATGAAATIILKPWC